MKSLKFMPHLVPKILSGEKTSTWRLFDDKDLTIGDELELIDWDSGECFGRAIITDFQEKLIGDLTEEELKNHGYESKEAMITSHRNYYGDRVE